MVAVVTIVSLGFMAGQGFGEPKGGRTLRVAVDKAEVMTLGAPASVVLVANSQIADVVVERDHLLFVIGKRPGETRLYIYGANGQPLLEREIVVVPQNDRSVTVFRDTMTTTYSCDERCVAINTQAGAGPVGAPAAPPAPASAAPPASAPPVGPTASR